MRGSFILFSVVVLSACSEVVNLQVRIYPTGEGEMALGKWAAGEIVSGVNKANPEGILKGCRSVQAAELGYRFHMAQFADVNTMEIGGIRFEYDEKEEGANLRVLIPTQADAPWYKSLGWSQKDIQRGRAVVALSEQWDGKEKKPEEEEEDVVIKVEIEMPGEIRQSRLIGDPAPDWTVEGGQLKISIPDVLAGKFNGVTWELACGPVTKEVRDKHERFKKYR